MFHRHPMLVVALSMYLGACASTPTSDGATRPSRSATGVITGDEIRSTGASNLYDAISLARPTFFASRGATSVLNEPAPFVVVMNRMVHGGVEQLRSLDARIVRSVRRLSAADVYQITGKASSSGGVEVMLGP
jgi:hypothetical protein